MRFGNVRHLAICLGLLVLVGIVLYAAFFLGLAYKVATTPGLVGVGPRLYLETTFVGLWWILLACVIAHYVSRVANWIGDKIDQC